MIRIEERDGVRSIVLVHGKANAMDLELCGALEGALRHAETSGARAVVLAAEGGIFSAGVDLVRLLAEGRPYIERFLGALDRAFEALFATPLPVVAAVNGHAIAGGCVLAQTADVRLVAAGTAKIGVPELLVGVPFPILVVEILRYATPARAPELLLTGRTVTLEEAPAWGLADRVCPAAELAERAHQAALELSATPPASFAWTKRALRAPALARWREAGDAVRRELVEKWCDSETLAAVRGYVERTLGKKR